MIRIVRSAGDRFRVWVWRPYVQTATVARSVCFEARVPNALKRFAPRSEISAQRRPFSTDIEPKLVFSKIENGVATLTLKDEKKRNALSSSIMMELIEHFESLEANRTVKVVLLRHDGKVFSSGHDLKELIATQAALGSTSSIFQTCSSLMLKIRSARFPVIAEVSGLATAGGCQLVAACDLAVAADTATFSTPGVRIGLFCSTPAVAISRTVPTKHAMEMLLTGDIISADKALAIGLVNRVEPAARLRESAEALALSIAQAPGETVALGKRAFYQQLSMPDVATAYAFAQGVMAANMGLPDAQEGIDAFIHKRKPTWHS